MSSLRIRYQGSFAVTRKLLLASSARGEICVHSRNTLSRPLRQDIKRICAVSSKFDAGSGVLRGRVVCCPTQPPRLPFAGRPVERSQPALPSAPTFEPSFGSLQVLCPSPRCPLLFC